MTVNRAVILAAGMGSRLKWLTQHKPKAMMQVQGEAAIVHVIRRLAGQGIHQIAINTFHHADVLMKFLGNGEKWGVNLVFSQEQSLLNSGGGVRNALDCLHGEGRVLVHNADVLADINVRELAQYCPVQGCALALVPNPVHHLQGDFALQGARVLAEGEPRYTFAGVSVWDESVLRACAANTAFSLIEPMRDCMAKGVCAGLLHRGQWFDIGRPKDLMQAHRHWSL